MTVGVSVEVHEISLLWVDCSTSDGVASGGGVGRSVGKGPPCGGTGTQIQPNGKMIVPSEVVLAVKVVSRVSWEALYVTTGGGVPWKLISGYSRQCGV